MSTTDILTRQSGPRPFADLPPDAARPIPFGRLLRVEWSKATDTRSARWLIGLTLAATALLMLAPLLAKAHIDQTQSSYLQFTAIPLTTLLPVVSIMTLTSEWTQRTVLTTFVQEPRRGRVIRAKVAVSLLMAVGAIAFGAIVTAAAVGIAEAGGRDIAADLGAGDVIGFVLFNLVNIGMGVAFGALLHNTAGSIVMFFVVPVVFGIVGSFADQVARWVDPGTTFNWMLDGDWGGGHGVRIATSALVWLVLPLVAGLLRTARREIK